MTKPRIGISIGDINGISLEIIIKSLGHPQVLELCTPIIYGSSKVLSYHKNIVGEDFHFQNVRSAETPSDGRINLVNCWQENVNIDIGEITADGGKYAFQSLEAATQDWRMGVIDALVTAPIHKKAMQMADFPYPGHTEYLAERVEAKDHLMLMVSDSMRMALATAHMPLKKVVSKISKGLIIAKLRILEECLRVDFGIEKPTIAVLGLNPHAGDEGVLGEEEEKVIRPAVVELKKKGMLVMGPFAADGFFGSGQFKKYDAILAMYHDQGLIPFKALSFGDGVNYTAGLPNVRTSPDHGTGFDIAGKNMANPQSFQKALFLAMDIARNRAQYQEDHKNPLQPSEKKASNKDTEADEVVKEEN